LLHHRGIARHFWRQVAGREAHPYCGMSNLYNAGDAAIVIRVTAHEIGGLLARLPHQTA
jgi:hypothetical protein